MASLTTLTQKADQIWESCTREHQSYIHALKREEELKQEVKELREALKHLQQENQYFITAKNRNNPKQCKMLMILLENVDDMGKYDDGGLSFSRAILDQVQAGKLCDNGATKVFCSAEESKREKQQIRKNDPTMRRKRKNESAPSQQPKKKQ